MPPKNDNKKKPTPTTVAIVPPAVLAEPDTLTSMSVQAVLGQVALIQQIMGAAMKDGEHYGKIPGCGDKPTLLKPGAEKLCLTFRMAPTYEIDERDGERGHREYRVTCSLSSILTTRFLGQGVGICSTFEAKYRFRRGNAEPTDKPVPRAYWDVRQEDPAKAQELIGGKGFSVKKVDGKGWMIAKGGEQVEHDNPADHYNTVLKMGKKRALVDAVLTATAASDLFSQDLEDITANIAALSPAPVAASPGGTAPAPEASPEGQDSGRGANAPQIDAGDVSATQMQFEPVDDPAPAPAEDWRGTRIHFGKNRGLQIPDLTPQQVQWYVADWMPKKELNGPTSAEDVELMRALKLWKRGADALASIVAALRERKILASQFEDYLRSRGEELQALGGLDTPSLERLAAGTPALLAEMVAAGC